MHFYPHNIADFNNATRHLTRVERSVYRDAIERYYDTECALAGNDFDKLCRLLLCVSDEEKTALKNVLDEFFTLFDGAYHHERCDLEIGKYRLNTSAKARAGKASAEARKSKSKQTLNTCSTDEQLTNNQELITNNQELITNLKDLAPQAEPVQKSKRATRLPENWEPTIEYLDAAKLINKNITDSRLREIAETFRDYWISKSGANATKNDWLAAWRNWIRREASNTQMQRSPPQAQFLTAREKTSQRNAEIFNIDRARDF